MSRETFLLVSSSLSQVWGILEELKEGLGDMGMVGPVSKPHRTGLHPKHRQSSLGALLTQFWCWSGHLMSCIPSLRCFEKLSQLLASQTFLPPFLLIFLLKDAGKWEEFFLKDSHQWTRNQQSMNMQEERHRNTVSSRKREVWDTTPLLWVLIQQTLLF